MKVAVVLFLLICSHVTFANTVSIGCNEQKMGCYNDQECVWMTQVGKIVDVPLVKQEVYPEIEIWEGKFSSLVYNQYPVEVTVKQRVNIASGEKTNYLTIKLEANGAEVISSSSGSVSAKLRTTDTFGVGYLCTSNL